MRALLRQIELEAAVAAALQTHIEPQLANYTHAIGWHQREQADREPFAQRLRLLGMRVRRGATCTFALPRCERAAPPPTKSSPHAAWCTIPRASPETQTGISVEGSRRVGKLA